MSTYDDAKLLLDAVLENRGPPSGPPPEHMGWEAERQVLRTMNELHDDHAVSIAVAIAGTVAGEDNAEAVVGALSHSMKPFYGDDTVITFGKDGAVFTETTDGKNKKKIAGSLPTSKNTSKQTANDRKKDDEQESGTFNEAGQNKDEEDSLVDKPDAASDTSIHDLDKQDKGDWKKQDDEQGKKQDDDQDKKQDDEHGNDSRSSEALSDTPGCIFVDAPTKHTFIVRVDHDHSIFKRFRVSSNQKLQKALNVFEAEMEPRYKKENRFEYVMASRTITKDDTLLALFANGMEAVVDWEYDSDLLILCSIVRKEEEDSDGFPSEVGAESNDCYGTKESRTESEWEEDSGTESDSELVQQGQWRLPGTIPNTTTKPHNDSASKGNANGKPNHRSASKDDAISKPKFQGKSKPKARGNLMRRRTLRSTSRSSSSKHNARGILPTRRNHVRSTSRSRTVAKKTKTHEDEDSYLPSDNEESEDESTDDSVPIISLRKSANSKRNSTKGAGNPKPRKDTRKNRGNRKRKAGSPAVNVTQQLDAQVREKLDGVEGPMTSAMVMSRPRFMSDKYNSESDSESVVDSKGWPAVVFGVFAYTMQQPNPNGGGGGKRRKHPKLILWTGSKHTNGIMEQAVKHVGKKKDQVVLETVSEYTELKEAVFGHKTIKQPQVNKIKNRRLKKEKEADESQANSS